MPTLFLAWSNIDRAQAVFSLFYRTIAIAIAITITIQTHANAILQQL
nr:hypothetical protein [uncultured bacterium]